MTHNQRILAGIQANFAVSMARRALIQQAQINVMESLREAIDGKRIELQALILAGKIETDTYRQTKAQLMRWTEAWNSNR